jgi:predicted nuclease of restriction endonuclease-like (RecB) superfamily
MEYKDNEKLQPLVGEISWTKHITIMSKCKEDLKREFYIKMTRKYGWTKSVLIHQIEGKSYE